MQQSFTRIPEHRFLHIRYPAAELHQDAQEMVLVYCLKQACCRIPFKVAPGY